MRSKEDRRGRGKMRGYTIARSERSTRTTPETFFLRAASAFNVLHDWLNVVGMEHRLANVFLHDW